MATIIGYRGLTNITTPDPSGDGGLMINNNFKSITDSILTVSGLIGTGGNTSVLSGYLIGRDSVISGYLDNRITFVSGLIGGSPTVLSGYLDNRITAISGQLSSYTTISYTSVLSGYLSNEDFAISGYNNAQYSTNTNSINISGYLSGRDFTISGYLDSKIVQISGLTPNTAVLSGYLSGRIDTVSGYFAGQLTGGSVTQTQLSNTSGYLDSRLTTVSGIAGGIIAISGYFTNNYLAKTGGNIVGSLSVSGNLVELQSNKNISSGYAGLDASGNLPGKIIIYNGITTNSGFMLSIPISGQPVWIGDSAKFSIGDGLTTVSGLPYISSTYINSISGYLDSKIGAGGGSSFTTLSGYLDPRINQVSGLLNNYSLLSYTSALSGYLLGYTNTTSGYLDFRITTISGIAGGISSVSGYFATKLNSYDTVTNASNISGYLDTRITTISGIAGGISAVSGYLLNKINIVSGYLDNKIINANLVDGTSNPNSNYAYNVLSGPPGSRFLTLNVSASTSGTPGVLAAFDNGGSIYASGLNSVQFQGGGSGISNLNANNIALGIVPTARLGIGTANSTTYLGGDSVYHPTSGFVSVDGNGNVIGNVTFAGSIQFRNGTSAALSALVPLSGQPIYLTDTSGLVIGNGSSTVGTIPPIVSVDFSNHGPIINSATALDAGIGPISLLQFGNDIAGDFNSNPANLMWDTVAGQFSFTDGAGFFYGVNAENFACSNVNILDQFGVIGFTNGSNAPSDHVGEIVTSIRNPSSGLSMSTTISSNPVSIFLLSGDWDITGVAGFTAGVGTTTTYIQGGISTASGNFGALGSYFSNPFAIATNSVDVIEPLPITRISISSNTRVFLVTNAAFSVGTLASYGFIRARRTR